MQKFLGFLSTQFKGYSDRLLYIVTDDIAEFIQEKLQVELEDLSLESEDE